MADSTTMLVIASYGFVGGLLAGSFLSVVAHRVPRGRSIVGPRSECPACGTTVAAYDNIPVVSWLLLRGRCRSCSAPIAARYPLLELGVGLSFAVTTALTHDDVPEMIMALLLIATLAVITVTDLERRIIPNRVLIAAAVAGAGVAAIGAPDTLAERGISAAAGGGFLLLAALMYPRGMGMGDVKLAAVMGLFLGRAIAPALLVAVMAGALVGLAMIARQGAGARKKAIPFGPFLALGGLVGLVAGDQIVEWYLDAFVRQ